MRVVVGGRVLEVRALWWEDSARGVVKMIDQRLLPWEFRIFESKSWRDTVWAIKAMVVRGAPSIGAAGAFAVAQAAVEYSGDVARIEEAAEEIKRARPTAVDLVHNVDRVLRVLKSAPQERRVDAAISEAKRISDRIVMKNRRIGEHGARLIKDGARVLTHCNAGALAAVDIGTALAPIRLAHAQGKKIFVYCTETRPWLQGARLTAWELSMEGIPHALICDSAAAYLMWRGEVDIVIVGADRIAANGDVANKIGTYMLALAARENDVPFYVAAPLSTFDPSTPTGRHIMIEERAEEEVTHVRGYSTSDRSTRELLITYPGCRAKNPVFDVTPAKLISGYITEIGVFEKISDLWSKLKELASERGMRVEDIVWEL